MTWPNTQPVNVAGEGSQVGVQAGFASIDTVTVSGDVQLKVGQDASPETKYRTGVENLKSGNPGMTRKLIWGAMMSDHVNNDVLFHWLVAMLSGRTVQQFSEEEIDQLKRSRSRYAEAGGDAWADGIRLIYRLLDSVLPSAVTGGKRTTAETDMSLLGCDRTVLLGGALDHFHLPRSRLIAHAFLEEPGVAVKRARIEGGPWRYARYRLLVFLLAEDGVRQVKANLDSWSVRGGCGIGLGQTGYVQI